MPHSRTLAAALALASLVTATSAAAAMPTPRALAAPGVGAPTSGDSLFPHQGNGGYDVAHYDLSLRYRSRGTVVATTAIEARTTAGPVSGFSLDLQGLKVTSVLVDGHTAGFSRVSDDPTYKLVVEPRAPVSGAFRVVVAYEGRPQAHTDPDGSSEGWNATHDGAIVLNEPVGAMTVMPTNNTTTDKATLTTRLRVPRSVGKGIGNGELASVKRHQDGTNTYTWQQPRPQAPFLTLVGIGRFKEHTSQVRLHGGLVVPEWSYADLPVADDGTVAERRGQLETYLRTIENRYGAYPGVATGLVLDAVPDGVSYALETQDRPFFPGRIGAETFVHELAHQWFGNAVSPSDWSDIWLSEGSATFIATQVLRDVAGAPTGGDTYREAWASTPADDPRWTVPVAGFDDPADLFGWQVYERGAMTIAALRSLIGGTTVETVMRRWVRQHDGGDGSTAEFIALSESVSGRDLTAFFEDWLHDTDKPAWPT